MAGYSRDEGVTSIQTEGEERQRTSELMQFEALGMIRIEKFKTSDFKENKMAYVPSAHISRRVDEAGTEENRAAQGQGRQRMNAWNTAWTALQDDGTVTEDSRNVNEGMLLSNSVSQHRSDKKFRSRSNPPWQIASRR